MQKLAVIALMGAVVAAEVSQKFSVDSKSRTFRDEFGRARIFHGQNVVVKLPNYLPT